MARQLLTGGLHTLGRLAASVPTPLRRVRVPRDLAEVTRVRPGAEVPGDRVGLSPGAVDEVWAAVQRVYRTGVHPAIALCLRRDGEVVVDRTIGHARGNAPGAPRDAPSTVATPDDPFVLASASKAITAMVVHLLDQAGELHVHDRVCEYVPEFATHGKQDITISQVLSHRSGVPNIRRDALDLDLIGDHDHVMAQLVDARPTHRPGQYIAYHAISGGFILGEVVHRVTGQSIAAVLRERILDPLGFTGLAYGVPADRVDEVVEDHVTGLPVLPPLSTALERALGRPVDEVVATLNDPRFLTGVVPAANVVGTADELSRFYELLRRGGTLDGVGIFEPRTVRRAVAEQSYAEVDLTLGFPFRYGMGFMLGARVLSLFGPNTRHAFGHLGFTNILGWADPERRVSAALLTSGNPVLGPHLLPLYDVMRTIASVAPRDGLVDGGLDWA